MSFCLTCDHARMENSIKFCVKHNKPLIRCAGGCTLNRKNTVTTEMLEKIETDKKRLLEPFLDKIVCGDAIEIMKQIPDNSIDVIVTSPPYNMLNTTSRLMKVKDPEKLERWTKAKKRYNPALINGYDVHSDDMPYDEYVAWQRNCLTEMVRIIKPTGFIFYNHKQRVQNGLLQHRMEIMEGFPLRQIITWHRNGGVNYNPGYFLTNVEQIFVLAKSKKAYLKPKSNAFGCVWKICQNIISGKKGHPAPFPVELPDKCLDSQILTNDSVVLDPFMGGGSTAISAIKHDAHYIGIDLSPGYCKMSEERISEFKNVNDQKRKNEIARTELPLINSHDIEHKIEVQSSDIRPPDIQIKSPLRYPGGVKI